jgi:SAM-dependent methyltransferase
MTGSPTETTYSGRDNLEAMKQASRYNDFLRSLIRKYAAGKRLLDHGAGAGTFAKPIDGDEFSVLCLEPDDDLRADLARSGLDTAASFAEIANASIDYAYTLNVLEHIGDDRAAIASLYQSLRPGGRLLVYVPAFQVLYSKMDEHVGHFRRYRRQPLKKLLREAGFEVAEARYADSLGFLATLVYKLVGDKSGRVSPGSVAFYDKLVFPLSRFIDFISFGMFGKNLIVVASKPEDQTHV